MAALQAPRARLAVRLLLMLAMGAVVNVVVAWMDVWLPIVRSNAVVTGSPEGNDVDEWRANAPIAVRDYEMERRPQATYGLGMCRQTMHALGPGRVGTASIAASAQPFAMWARVRTGWPMTCFAGEYWIWRGSQDGLIQHRSSGAVSLAGQSPRMGPVIPIAPLWPGFAVNTVFYAGVLWLVFCGPFALRRSIRRRRGRCAACGYLVGTSAVCSECGAAVLPLPRGEGSASS